MAFTIEQINTALTTRDVYHVEPIEKLQATEAYSVFADYLTGKSSTLAVILQDFPVHVWRRVFNLLQNIEDPSADDQLILNFIHHPGIRPFLAVLSLTGQCRAIFNISHEPGKGDAFRQRSQVVDTAAG